jgi:hypothetical protein
MSGGDGYIDFRVDEDDPSISAAALSKGDRSHLIVWELMQGNGTGSPAAATNTAAGHS